MGVQVSTIGMIFSGLAAICGLAAIRGLCWGAKKFGPSIYCWIKCRLFRYQQNSSVAQVGNVSQQQIDNIYKKIQPQNVEWKTIQITKNDKEVLEYLTTNQFWEVVKLYECIIAKGNQVMRKPVGMKCCQGKQLADKNNLLKALHMNPRICPLCGSQLSQKQNWIIEDGRSIELVKYGIQQFRKRIKITFQKASQEFKKQLKQGVEACFGQDYVI